MVGQQTAEQFRLVVFPGALPMAFDLLQRDDIGARHDLGGAFELA